MSREQFEAWWEINYHNGNPPRFGWAAYREDGGYKIDDDESELDAMWNAWQAATNATEAKCAALAAENAGLKAAAEFATAPDMWEELGGNVMRYQYQEWYADKLKSAIQTPATDAYLAEVRAQGADECVRQLVISDDDDFSDAPNVCAMVAHQLRQDANTAELVAAGIITKVGE
ncbi:hypothetical protein ACYA5G_05340 [Klebsiella pneumoniae]|uniref:hypothetical protein n=1 Tax=Klebsiella pneumoniae TaxID=573 RepID=UPI001CF406BB|nr:hypothetical protein [Klebsiella pneumoniae]MCA6701566.1 hypothetical protein [Klebsiella pneumoniae]